MQQKMKVVIVDDELPLRDELRDMDLGAYGYQLAGEAANGREAIAVCRKVRPDIVITDITMPVMDGLEFIANIKNEMPLTKYIILTCHQDFEYAKKAIAHNAVDYILKADICEEEIVRVLDKARHVLEKEQSYIKKLKEENQIKISGYSLKDEAHSIELENDLKKLGFKIHSNEENHYLIMDNRLGSWVFVELMVRGILKESGRGVKSWILLEDGIYGIVLDDSQKPDCFVKNMIEDVQEAFPFVNDRFRFFIVVSEKRMRSGKEYVEEKKEVPRWKAEAFYYPEKIVIREAGIKPFCLLDDKIKQDFADAAAVPFDSEDEAEIWFDKWSRKTHLWPVELKKLLLSWMEGGNPDLNLIQKEEVRKRVDGAWDIAMLSTCFVRDCRPEMISFGRYEVRKAIRIIRAEYGKNLSQSSVSERIGINAQYLGKLFQEETGEKFGDYLTRLRMEHARKLLEEGDLRVYEVADRVGIPNYRYFTQKFREWYGISPKEFQKKR